MISVVIPLYNKRDSIARTIESVLKQTFTDFEIIVVDDGSKDGSSEIVRSFEDERIKIIQQENAGVAAARNRGIKASNGEFVALLDGDDEWLPDFLSTQMALATHYENCDVFAVDYQFRDHKGTESSTIIKGLPFAEEDGELTNYFEVAAISHPPICSISIMARKKALDAIGGFPVGIRSGEDLLTWARLACNYRIAYSRKVCATYNLGAGYDFANTPPRRQDEGDPVGRELELLNKKYHPIGMNQYLSHWHKMRASVAIRYFERYETLKEAFLSLKFHPTNRKILPFFILPFFPKNLLKKIFIAHQ